MLLRQAKYSMSNKPYFMLGAVALVGIPLAVMYMDKKKPSEPERTLKAGYERASEIKGDVKNRGAEASRKFQDKASEVKGAVSKGAQEIGHEADEAGKHAAEKGNSWLRWGSDKANEAGNQAERTLGRTEEEAKKKASELKSGLVRTAEDTKEGVKNKASQLKAGLERTAEETKEQAKNSAGGWFDWGAATYDKAEDTKEMIKDRANAEAGKHSSAANAITEQVHDQVKDMTIMVDKKAQEAQNARAKGSA